jgi:beta-N-acetylhexosaminidase
MVPDETALREYIARMTPEEKIGQLFMLCLSGEEITDEMRIWIGERYIGGLAIFGKNAASSKQLAKLTADMQETALKTRLGIPLFIATDHEPGDKFMPIKLGKTFPPALTLASKGGPQVIRDMAEAMAKDLAGWGINMNFYPVADVDRTDGKGFMGDRTFGTDPEKVAEYTAIVVDMFNAYGIIPVAKHFPGHGGTTKDSHKTMPIIKKSLAALKAKDFIPYYKAMEKGLPAVMMAHILYPMLDANHPATLSKIIIRNLLRNDMGFDGIVITDELLMDAIKKNYSIPEACRLAIEAGADILLITRPYLMKIPVEKVYQSMVGDLKKGLLNSTMVDDAVYRILKTKAIYLGFQINAGQ